MRQMILCNQGQSYLRDASQDISDEDQFPNTVRAVANLAKDSQLEHNLASRSL